MFDVYLIILLFYNFLVSEITSKWSRHEGIFPSATNLQRIIHNIVVIADEAHRSQYDFIDGFARHVHDSLPNASFIGFTATPIESGDKNTRAVFGDYIDQYDMVQSVEDGFTVGINYDGRFSKIGLLQSEKQKIDPQFEFITESQEEDERRKLQSKWARLEAIALTPQNLQNILQIICKNRMPPFCG